MLNMSQINHIRDLSAHDYSISDIHRMTGVDRKTIRKYLNMKNFSPETPQTEKRPSKLDPYKEIIDGWLEEDKRNGYKQRHTAKRIYDRLVAEHGYEGSYNIVQRYVKEARIFQKIQRANQELIWEPGTAQADFGEADFIEMGMTVRKKYLVLSFPHSNDSFCQVFGGENSECVCQGLLDIFYYIGGVPQNIVFDNATGVGRKVCDERYGESIELAHIVQLAKEKNVDVEKDHLENYKCCGLIRQFSDIYKVTFRILNCCFSI